MPPPPMKQCDLGLLENAERFQSFIIGAAFDGKEIAHAAEPDRTANYFGGNPESPHHLTRHTL